MTELTAFAFFDYKYRLRIETMELATRASMMELTPFALIDSEHNISLY